MTYTEVRFKVKPKEDGIQILIAQLGELGFESFIEEVEYLKAYIKTEQLSTITIEDCQLFKNPDFELEYTIHDIEDVNWNQAWEENFKPVHITPNCVIRAPFHEKFDLKYELIIEPKMSFGTGHHPTTHMMMQMVLEESLNNLSVLDMGCGTGVLSILAEKLGAKPILAIDIDEWCFINTLENKERNECENINVKQGGEELIEGRFDVVLANINRNILLEHLPIYNRHLKQNGMMFLSGFYDKDLEKIDDVCQQLGLNYVKHQLKNEWICAKYVKV
ncbi:50S ribosomal protein L11 methyltransferase [Mesohalobacter halotolerans]|uniref:Ribosomal protein L11 methyltransferase n=1 Tax=Mesohalobacter halotolerans TaxID=1883405 RepID=A0A4U5TTA8_9FLAO|nr:50S ribosomal protein L11 methyltransferase [Mesohalobacter halotolerans]TKS57282.1 50S ribosomal protein L11 methyltransferase [Mesohalobacter halotolerans]